MERSISDKMSYRNHYMCVTILFITVFWIYNTWWTRCMKWLLFDTTEKKLVKMHIVQLSSANGSNCSQSNHLNRFFTTIIFLSSRLCGILMDFFDTLQCSMAIIVREMREVDIIYHSRTFPQKWLYIFSGMQIPCTRQNQSECDQLY